MPPSEHNIRCISCSLLISKEKKATVPRLCKPMKLAMFSVKAVLPIEGLAATNTRSEGCRPLVMASRSLKPAFLAFSTKYVTHSRSVLHFERNCLYSSAKSITGFLLRPSGYLLHAFFSSILFPSFYSCFWAILLLTLRYNSSAAL